MLGYKVSLNGNVAVLITLEIPEDALTNLERRSIVNKQTAMYRTNKAKVIKIEDRNGTLYQTSEISDALKTLYVDENKYIYRVGESIEDPMYHTDVENGRHGIYFFLAKKVACQYNFNLIGNFNPIKDGYVVTWYPNGQKSSEGAIKNGDEEGWWQYWHINGQKYSEGLYKNGKKAGAATVLAYARAQNRA